MKKFITTTLVILFSMVVFAQNQTQTAYEKKVFEIKKNYVKKILIQNGSWTRQSEAELYYAGEDYINTTLALVILMAPNLVESLKTELKAAEKLKTAVDFQREKEAKERAEQEKYERSDRGSIQKNIKSEFQAWIKKGEFEKQGDFDERLQSQSQSRFIEICIVKIKEKINSLVDDYYNSPRLKNKLLKYDSENEIFPVSFEFNGKKWQSNLKITISNAENFKSEWDDLWWKKDEYDWCFIENSLLPTTITLQKTESNTKYHFALSLQNQQEISVAFNDLEIENEYLKDFVFKYSTAKEMDLQIARQKQISDSLEFASYNNKLVELVNSYNQLLLKNKYNIEQKIITYSYQLNKDYLGNKKRLEQDFERESNAIKSEFERLKSEFEAKRNYEYRNNGKLFTSESEFDTIYTKGKKTYQSEIDRKQKLDYLMKNVKLLETMDFLKKDEEYVKDREKIVSIISESKNKSYYSQIVDFVVETNKGLNKEWAKNGQFFENKIEFWESFISENYKKILKAKKKK